MSEPMNRRGLGRGLSALLGDAPPEAAAGGPPPDRLQNQEVPIELLRRNPDQPRRMFSEAELQELSNSIREKGVLQPILVRPAPGAPGEYQIVAGERRWRASQLAGLRNVPVIVREDLNDLDLLEIGVIENVQRENLNSVEEAQAYKILIDRFGRTQEEIGKTVGKSRSHIANTLRLLSLPAAVLKLIEEGALTAGHARAVATAADPERLARQITDKGLSVRQAEDLARGREPSAKSARAGSAPRRSPDTLALEQDLSETLGLKVTLDDRQGAGELRIAYATLEQLDDICRRLTGA